MCLTLKGRAFKIFSMPAKNRIKPYVENSYYHIYNRGVEKRIIFMDEQDYGVFLSYLKTYLLPKDANLLEKIVADSLTSPKQKADALKLLRLNNFSDCLSLVAYCLMPNHFHLLVKQTEADTIDRFMNSLCTRYSMYFNKRYKRVGPLFQGLYKGVLVNTDEQLLHLTRYIHRNPASKGPALKDYKYSSYSIYLGIQTISWVEPKMILSHFGKSEWTSYQSFIEDSTLNESSIKTIKNLIIDIDNN